MSVVSRPHFELVRARKSLETAFKKGDWEAMREWDAQLGERLNAAFDDEGRNSAELIKEMERVLHAYAELIAALPESASTALNSFPRTR